MLKHWQDCAKLKHGPVCTLPHILHMLWPSGVRTTHCVLTWEADHLLSRLSLHLEGSNSRYSPKKKQKKECTSSVPNRKKNMESSLCNSKTLEIKTIRKRGSTNPFAGIAVTLDSSNQGLGFERAPRLVRTAFWRDYAQCLTKGVRSPDMWLRNSRILIIAKKLRKTVVLANTLLPPEDAQRLIIKSLTYIGWSFYRSHCQVISYLIH